MCIRDRSDIDHIIRHPTWYCTRSDTQVIWHFLIWHFTFKWTVCIQRLKANSHFHVWLCHSNNCSHEKMLTVLLDSRLEEDWSIQSKRRQDKFLSYQVVYKRTVSIFSWSQEQLRIHLENNCSTNMYILAQVKLRKYVSKLLLVCDSRCLLGHAWYHVVLSIQYKLCWISILALTEQCGCLVWRCSTTYFTVSALYPSRDPDISFSCRSFQLIVYVN